MSGFHSVTFLAQIWRGGVEKPIRGGGANVSLASAWCCGHRVGFFSYSSFFKKITII